MLVSKIIDLDLLNSSLKREWISSNKAPIFPLFYLFSTEKYDNLKKIEKYLATRQILEWVERWGRKGHILDSIYQERSSKCWNFLPSPSRYQNISSFILQDKKLSSVWFLASYPAAMFITKAFLVMSVALIPKPLYEKSSVFLWGGTIHKGLR